MIMSKAEGMDTSTRICSFIYKATNGQVISKNHKQGKARIKKKQKQNEKQEY